MTNQALYEVEHYRWVSTIKCAELIGRGDECLTSYTGVQKALSASKLVTELSEAIRYCLYIPTLDENLRSLAEKLHDALYPFFDGSKNPHILTALAIVSNALQNYEISLSLFNSHEFIDSNPHSQYRRTFAESALGAGMDIDDPRCGVILKFPTLASDTTPLTNLTNIQSYSRSVKDEFRKFLSELQCTEGIHQKNVFLLSMNESYFNDFGIPQAISILKNYKGSHNLIIAAIFRDKESYQVRDELIRAFSRHGFDLHIFYYKPLEFEDNLSRNTFLSCIRFQLSHLVINEIKPSSITVTDADQLFLRPVETSDLSNIDLEIFDHTEKFSYVSLYAKYGASYVKIFNTPRGNKFAVLLDKFIENNQKRTACWTLDQFALLYISRRTIDLRIRCLPSSEMSDRPDAALFNAAGSAKYDDPVFSNYLSRLKRELDEHVI